MDITLVTLNCAKQQQPAQAFEGLVRAALPELAPNFVVVGLQEVAPIREAAANKRQDYVRPIMKGIESALRQVYPNIPFSYINDCWSGAVGVVCFSRDPVENTDAASVGFGYGWSTMKGAAVVSVVAGGATLKFVSCHLAANSGNAETRNLGYAILANALTPGGRPLFDKGSKSHVFVLGDLNYRALGEVDSHSGDDSESATGPASASGASQTLLQQTFDQIDELTVERKNGRTLWGMHESPVKFRPTFKFFIGTEDYNRKRTPSWTDRILYSAETATVAAYDSVPSYQGSDHKPVYLQINVDPETTLGDIVVPEAGWYGAPVSSAVDYFISSGLFLSTTPAGWVILGALALISVYLLF